MGRRPLLLPFVAIATVAACGCKKPEPEPEPPAVTARPAKVPASVLDAAVLDAAVLAATAVDATVIDAGKADALLATATKQLVVVTTADWKSPRGTMRRFTRAAGAWTVEPGPHLPVMIGGGGLGWGLGIHPSSDLLTGARKTEGDGRSPAGVFAIGDAFGYSTKAPDGSRLPYTRSEADRHRCVDDPNSKSYNRIVDAKRVTVDWSSAEILRRRDELYRWVIEVDHNHLSSAGSPVPGRGSCIFFHVWRRPEGASVGCAMMSRGHMEELMRWLEPASSPVVVLLPESVYRRLAPRWQLPAL